MDLDLEDALLDPDVTDLFTVTRRKEVVSSKGRSTVPVPEVIEEVAGTICAAHGNELDRLEDADRMGRALSIVTKFQLRGPAKVGADVYKPDIITWRGDDFVVRLVDPYGHVGSGFVQAIAVSVDIVDQAPSTGSGA